MNKIFNAEFYDFLIKQMEACIYEIGQEEITKHKNMVIMGTNVTLSFEMLMAILQKQGLDLKIIIVAQPQMLNKISAFVHGKCQYVEWRGKYTTDIVENLKTTIDISEIDSFFYFGSQVDDLRDINYWKIADLLEDCHSIDVFAMDSAKKIYQIKNIKKYVATMELYLTVNKFLETIGG